MIRILWDEYFMNIAKLVSERSTCNKLSVGCVMTIDRRIIATGYNGAPRNLPHCLDIGCLEINNHCIRSLHAEVNAILQCAANGIATKGSNIYLTVFPCWNCSLMLINAEIDKIFYIDDYIDDRGNQKDLFIQADIEIIKLWFKEFGNNIAEEIKGES